MKQIEVKVTQVSICFWCYVHIHKLIKVGPWEIYSLKTSHNTGCFTILSRFFTKWKRTLRLITIVPTLWRNRLFKKWNGVLECKNQALGKILHIIYAIFMKHPVYIWDMTHNDENWLTTNVNLFNGMKFFFGRHLRGVYETYYSYILAVCAFHFQKVYKNGAKCKNWKSWNKNVCFMTY